MSIRCVALPTGSESDSDSSSDLLPAPVRRVAPKRTNAPPTPAANPFEVDATEETPMPTRDLDYVSIGLPPLSLESDPFLSPVQQVRAIVTHKKSWKRDTFILSVGGFVVLVAKRKTKRLKRTWFISRSKDFSLDTPDIAGIVIRRRKSPTFSILSARERQSDGFREVLAGVKLGGEQTKALVGQGLWMNAEADDAFHAAAEFNNVAYMKMLPYQFRVSSSKNAALGLDETPSFVAEKMHDQTSAITVSNPLCLVQGFGLAISLFVQ